MGFKIPKRTATIILDEGDYAGAEVTVSLDVSMATFFRYGRLAGEDVSMDDLEAAFRDFGSLIVSWNLDDDAGRPLPVSAENFLSLPPAFNNALITKWQEAVTKVPTPLAGRSESGAPLPEAPIPMVTPSGSRGS